MKQAILLSSKFIRRQSRNRRGQVMGTALAVMFVVVGIAAFGLLCNICLSIYYKQKLTHVAAVLAEDANLTPAAQVNGRLNTALTDTLSLMGIASIFKRATPTVSASPYTVQVDVVVPLLGNGPVPQVPMRAMSSSPENSQVGYLTAPGSMTSNQQWLRAPQFYGGPNYCAWLPIIKSPPAGTGTPQGSWFLLGTELGTPRTDDGRTFPSAGGAIRWNGPSGAPGSPGSALDPR